jgi:hypothetical protein
MVVNAEKLAKLAEQVRTGGKGSVRRKMKGVLTCFCGNHENRRLTGVPIAVHRTVAVDDKKLEATLKRMGVSPIPAIEEVNMFKNDGTVIHFVNPKGLFFVFSLSSLFTMCPLSLYPFMGCVGCIIVILGEGVWNLF